MATMMLNSKWFKTEDFGSDPLEFIRANEDLTPMGSRHKCVSSADLVTKFREKAHSLGLTLGQEKFGLEKRHEGRIAHEEHSVNEFGADVITYKRDIVGGKKFLYLADVVNENKPDFCLTIGFRNFSDKSLSFQSIAGTRVFVCQNGCCNAICADGKMRHSIGNVDRNVVSGKIDAAFKHFIENKDSITHNIEMMKSVTLTDAVVGAFVKKMLHNQIVSGNNLLRVLEELENPTLNSHDDNSVFRLANAASYVTTHLVKNPSRGITMSREFNNAILGVIDPAFAPLGDVIDVTDETADEE